MKNETKEWSTGSKFFIVFGIIISIMFPPLFFGLIIWFIFADVINAVVDGFFDGMGIGGDRPKINKEVK